MVSIKTIKREDTLIRLVVLIFAGAGMNALLLVFSIWQVTLQIYSTPCPEINSTKDNITVQQWKTECNTVEGQMTIIPVIAIFIIIIIMIIMITIVRILL